MRTRLVPIAVVLIAIALLASALWRPVVGTAAGEQIVVTTEPPLDQIHPHGGPGAEVVPDRLIVEVKDATGKNIPNVVVDLQMDAPATNWFISTDVPLVEGRTLLKLRGVAPNGRLEIDYMFPIRGTYRLAVKASPAPGAAAGFTPFSRELDLPISEKPSSYVNLGVFLLVLFGFGVISGLIIGRANAAARAG
ncbi:MAG: hypothetical protein HY331_07195 [Chloroflexi bacterium]|nr:hypothetical protein [Chloroflexota bacterium]